MKHQPLKATSRLLIIALALSLILPPPGYAQAPTAAQISAGISGALNTLSPLHLAANALMDHAIDKGNDALAERLRQLDGIIQSAIFNLNRMLQERTQDLDEKVRIQRMETVREFDRLSQQISNTLKVSFDQLGEVLDKNITNFQNGVGNAIASLPIPTEPLVNIPHQHELAVIANASGNTRLFITGSGLYKDGRKPEAFIHNGPDDRNGTRLTVEVASMGMLSVVIPTSLIPATATPKEYQLSLGLNKGALFGSNIVWPSFPVVVCGPLPRYVARAKLTATSGAYWEKTTTDRRWFYVDSQPAFTITASLLVNPPWQVDVDRFHSGLDIIWDPPTSPGGSGEHNEGWTNGGFFLWVGGKGGNNSHAFARAALKKISPIDVCGSFQEEKSLIYDHLNQFHLDKKPALGSCDLSLRTPEIKAIVEILRQGKLLETVNLAVPMRDQAALNGQMTLAIDGDGLLNIALKPYCTRPVGYLIEKEVTERSTKSK